MANNIRVLNKNHFSVGLKKMDGIGINIKPGSFALLSEEDVQWINSVSEVFAKGIVRLEEKDAHILTELGVHVEENPNVLTDDQIAAELRKTAKSIDKWLTQITEQFVLAHIAEIALTMDLPKSKLDTLGKYVNLDAMTGE